MTSAKEIDTSQYTEQSGQSTRRLPIRSFGLRASERKLLLSVIDVLLLCIALILAVRIRTDLLPDISAVFLSFKWYFTLVMVWAVMANVFDVYSLARSAEPGLSLWASIRAVGFTGLIYLGIPWLTPPLANRSYGVLFVLSSVILVSSWRFLYARLFIQPVFQRRSLIVGAGQSGTALIRTLKSGSSIGSANPYHSTGHQIIGFVDDDPRKKDELILGLPILGNSKALVKLVETLQIDEIVIAITESNSIRAELYEAILDCRERGVPIVTMPTIYERLTGRVAIDHSGLNVELATGQSDSAFLRMFNISKRVVDIFAAVFGLMVVLLISPFIALANAIFSPGPLFFKQERMGQGGNEFSVIKFRSMIPEAEKDSGAVWASENDTRVTSFGRFLRNTHIDEIPQFVNVIRGEMSLVGPRPERSEFVYQLSTTIPFYRARHSVRPGITGWAQIHQDYGDSFEGAREKLEYDLFYVKNAGIRLDTIIILRTITKVLGLRGR